MARNKSNISGINEKFKKRLSEEKLEKVIQVSSDLGVNPNDLLLVMNLESGIDESIYNGITGKAVGLIQFHPDPNKDYKTIGGKQHKISDIAKMDFNQQMDLVKDYISDVQKSNKNADLTNFDELYTAVYYPSALGKGMDYKIGGAVTAEQNPTFAVDGQVTKGSFLTSARNRAEKEGYGSILSASNNEGSEASKGQSEPSKTREEMFFEKISKRNKKKGFRGDAIKNSKGQFMNEKAYKIQINGIDTEIPMVIPSTTKAELEFMKNNNLRDNENPIAQAIIKKGEEHAQKRISQGLSPFFDESYAPDLNYVNNLSEDEIERERTDEEKKKAKEASERYKKDYAEIKSMGFSPIEEANALKILNSQYYERGESPYVNQEINKWNTSSSQQRLSPKWEYLGPMERAKYGSSIAYDRYLTALEKEDSEKLAEEGWGPETKGIIPILDMDSLGEEYHLNTWLPKKDEEEEEKRAEESRLITLTEEELLRGGQEEPKGEGEKREYKDPTDFYLDNDVPKANFEYIEGDWSESLLKSLPELAVGAAAAIAGMDKANQEAPVRDDRITDALMNYAAQMKKITKMGLDPEVEGDLKNKLASAYQLGLENLTKASGGNRNLVLGNQGQLDEARMKGITDIALMDVNRRDAAMAGYGEVIQYIEEFERSKNAENSAREYQKYQTETAMGAQLAQQGVAKILNEIEYQRTNGPGSANDMTKKYWEYYMTGVIPGKESGPGSKAYEEERLAKQNALKTEEQKMREYFAALTPEERTDMYEVIEKNPQLQLKKNKEAKAEEIIKQMNQLRGIEGSTDVSVDMLMGGPKEFDERADDFYSDWTERQQSVFDQNTGEFDKSLWDKEGDLLNERKQWQRENVPLTDENRAWLTTGKNPVHGGDPIQTERGARKATYESMTKPTKPSEVSSIPTDSSIISDAHKKVLGDINSYGKVKQVINR